MVLKHSENKTISKNLGKTFILLSRLVQVTVFIHSHLTEPIRTKRNSFAQNGIYSHKMELIRTERNTETVERNIHRIIFYERVKEVPTKGHDPSCNFHFLALGALIDFADKVLSIQIKFNFKAHLLDHLDSCHVVCKVSFCADVRSRSQEVRKLTI